MIDENLEMPDWLKQDYSDSTGDDILNLTRKLKELIKMIDDQSDSCEIQRENLETYMLELRNEFNKKITNKNEKL